MLEQRRVMNAFEEKQDAFAAYAAERSRQQDSMEQRIEAELADLNAAAVTARLEGIELPGALPTDDYDQAAALFCRPFGRRWSDHQEARAWAGSILRNRTVIAVDGSQISPSPDFYPPVGAVQIGWFINEHCGGRYEKDLDFAVLAPEDLRDRAGDDGDESYAVQTVNQERFVRECRQLQRLMARYAQSPDEARPVCFFDGSFVISFAGKISQPRSVDYVTAIEGLLDDAGRFRVPLVGFVDNSRSRDLVMMVSHLLGEGGDSPLNDGDLLARRLPAWGDRSPIFQVARNDGLSRVGRAKFYGDLCFCYMRLNRTRPPARIELPKWLVDGGAAEQVLDIVRAECIVGTGYPYAIETADALAVISAADRQRFYALFQRFADRSGLDFRQTRKAASKQQRR